MLKLKIFFINFLLIQLIVCLKPNNFCIKFDKECKQALASKNKTNCKKITCYGEYSYDCGDYCSSDLKVCKKFQKLRFQINYFALPNLKNIIKYKDLIKKIDDCSKKNYDLNPNNVCSNNCINKSKIQRKGFKELIFKSSCKCDDKYPYRCGEKYCSKNVLSCNQLIKINLSDSIKKRIKSCENQPKLNKTIDANNLLK